MFIQYISYFYLKEEFPEGFITESDYITQFRQIYKNGNPKKFALFAFKTFDKNKDGMISFDEFLFSTCFLIQEGQSWDEKAKRLELAFSMFDVNKDGKISKAEMKKVYDALYQTYNFSTNGTQKIVNDLFKKYDANKSGDLDIQEFICALNDENLFNFFSI